MPASRALQFFQVMIIAFAGIMIASALQLLVQWQHPSDTGWITQFSTARSGNWACWTTLAVSGLLGAAMLIFGIYSFTQRRYIVGASAVAWATALIALPEAPFLWTAIAAGVTGVITLIVVISLIAARGKSAPAETVKKTP